MLFKFEYELKRRCSQSIKTIFQEATLEALKRFKQTQLYRCLLSPVALKIRFCEEKSECPLN